MVCLFYGSCCGNHELGIIKCAAVVPQTNTFCSKTHTNSEKQKKTNMSNNSKIWWEHAKNKTKKNTKGKKRLFNNCLPQIFVLLYTFLWFAYNPVCRVKKVWKIRTWMWIYTGRIQCIPMRTLVDFRLRDWDVYFWCLLDAMWDLKIKIIHDNVK